jgi:twitching motility protein PilT
MAGALADLPFIDLYIRLDESDRPLFRSNLRGKGNLNQFVPDAYLDAVNRFAATAIAALAEEQERSIDFENVRCRLSRQSLADGTVWACARRINTHVPELAKLGFAPHIHAHLHQLGARDGLIIVSGSAGQGKTTTAAGLLADFMRTYGGLAITIEDPVEYVMKGRHGDYGQCFQLEAKGDDDWEIHLKRGLRWAPRYVFVGEVRTPKAAEQLLRAATTGHMVVTTVHASAPEEALMSLLFLAEQAMGAGATEILAGCLTALVHQSMKEMGPFVRYLFTEENAPGDPIRSLIREGKIGMISTYIDRIAARLANQPGMAQTMPAFSMPQGGLPPLPSHGGKAPDK